MSEYQYYEFLAVDRPLDRAAREALRAISTRAQITATSFVNSYDWGDFKGNPGKLMARWFDMHVYVANWGSRRLMLRLPARLVPRRLLDAVLVKHGPATAAVAGENLILDIGRGEMDLDDWDDDGTTWLAALLPLREAAMSGDLRLLYFVWLLAVDMEEFASDRREPLPGLGPLTEAHEAFATFFAMDMDLVRAAAEVGGAQPSRPSTAAIRERIAAMPDSERIELLTRLAEGGSGVAVEITATLRRSTVPVATEPAAGRRTVGELIARAEELRVMRERAEEKAAAAKRKRAVAAEAKAAHARLDELARRGQSAWDAVEAEIGLRSPVSYRQAVRLLRDLQILAEENGTSEEFGARLQAIRERHARKGQLIAHLRHLDERE